MYYSPFTYRNDGILSKSSAYYIARSYIFNIDYFSSAVYIKNFDRSIPRKAFIEDNPRESWLKLMKLLIVGYIYTRLYVGLGFAERDRYPELRSLGTGLFGYRERSQR
jgi:hypothetical protein